MARKISNYFKNLQSKLETTKRIYDKSTNKQQKKYDDHEHANVDESYDEIDY